MRNQRLTGYLLHHKPYQENRALYYLFTPTHGLLHGVGKKGMPLFTLMQLFATGKRSLKSFSQIQPMPSINSSLYLLNDVSLNDVPFNDVSLDNSPRSLTGHNLYAGFYLNEILWKLLETEEPMPKLWQYYQLTLNGLCVSADSLQMKLLLRHFEWVLFTELGRGVSLDEDSQGKPLQAGLSYRLLMDEGFLPVSQPQQVTGETDIGETVTKKMNSLANISIFSGSFLTALESYLQTASQTAFSASELQDWSRLNKLMVDHLLDYQLLKSRELWRQFMRYQ